MVKQDPYAQPFYAQAPPENAHRLFYAEPVAS